MKHLGLVVLTVAIVVPVWAQEPPGSAESAGLVPKTSTIYVNAWAGDTDPRNNGSTESTGVAIASNGNIIVGWEDDGDDIFDYESVWTLFGPDGKAIIGAPRSYFKKDGSPTGPQHAWGPKIKANLFGSGIGMGATAFDLALEIEELFDVNTVGGDPDVNAGDFPAVQLLTDDGAPIGIPLIGLTDEYAERDGDIRIGDWDYLSNGNIVIVGESRQEADLVDIYNGDATGKHPIYRILKPDGTEVVPVTLVSQVPVAGEMWHGVGVTQNGFAVRWASQGRTTVRIFDNDGNPKTGNIDIGQLTGVEGTSQGGRGDGTGFHGNGVDTYVLVNSADADDVTGKEVYLTALKADGSLKWTTVASSDYLDTNADRVDCAVSADGAVLAVWTDNSGFGQAVALPLGRLFKADGTALSGVRLSGAFYLSEVETLELATSETRRPRAAWRGNTIAVVWESQNSPDTASRVVALRVFQAPAGTGVPDFVLY